MKQANKRNKVFIPVWLVAAVDLILVNAAFLLAFSFRFGGQVPVENIEAFRHLAPFLSPASLLFFAGTGLYNVKRYPYKQIFRLLALATVLIFFFSMALAFWLREFAMPRSVLVIAVVFQLALLVAWRSCLLRLEKRLHGTKRLMIVSHEEQLNGLLPKILALPSGWFKIDCIYPPESAGGIMASLEQVDAVLLAAEVSQDDKQRILARCFEVGCEAMLVPDLYDILLKKSLNAQLADTPVMEIAPNLISPFQLLIKRCLDFSVAGATLFLFLPVMAAIVLLIKLTSPGPVFYIQQRMGYQGRVFNLYKFRSMVDNAEQLSGPVLAVAADSRITPFGKIIRTSRLDELPQLLNIIRGEMSLVGPRPERPAFAEDYLAGIPAYRYRYFIKPGLTGLAQVRSRYATSANDKIRYDLNYMVNYSLLLDLRILLETIPALFSPENSLGVLAGENGAAYNLPEGKAKMSEM